jgi:spore coat protein U-like protein
MTRYPRGGVVLISVAALSVAMSVPASAAEAVSVEDAVLQTGGSSVQLTVGVTCDAPAGATSYLTTTIWQGNSTRTSQRRYIEGQGQTQITCDSTAHTYSFTATNTTYPDRRFKPGPAMAEFTIQYCVAVDASTTQCTPIFPLIRQATRIHR